MNVTALAATGQLGTGFQEHTLVGAARSADFIGCDAGSSDPVPYYLGSGETQSADASVGRDLELMIREGLANGIPVLVGSAGTAGGRPHLERGASLTATAFCARASTVSETVRVSGPVWPPGRQVSAAAEARTCA